MLQSAERKHREESTTGSKGKTKKKGNKKENKKCRRDNRNNAGPRQRRRRVVKKKIIVGTRGSKLALIQTDMFVEALTNVFNVDVEVKTVKSFGDIVQDRPLYKMRSRGVFVKKLDALLLDGKIDVAVHSMKDIPLERPPSLETAAVLPRDSPYDVLISNERFTEVLERREVRKDEVRKKNGEGGGEREIDLGDFVVGTSSVRRRLQIMHRFPDVRVEDIRGNVDTRIRKLRERMYDAIVLAEAGVQRLGLDLEGFECVEMRGEPFVPAPNQGIIAVVTRAQSEESEMIREIDDEKTRIEASIEEEILRVLGGGCATPIGALARAKGREVEIEVYVGISPAKYIYERSKVRTHDMDEVRAFAMRIKRRWEEINESSAIDR